MDYDKSNDRQESLSRMKIWPYNLMFTFECKTPNCFKNSHAFSCNICTMLKQNQRFFIEGIDTKSRLLRYIYISLYKIKMSLFRHLLKNISSVTATAYTSLKSLIPSDIYIILTTNVFKGMSDWPIKSSIGSFFFSIWIWVYCGSFTDWILRPWTINIFDSVTNLIF